MSEQTPCKNCKKQTHPHFLRKYKGYCLECNNAGVPEFLDEREAMRAAIRLLIAEKETWTIRRPEYVDEKEVDAAIERGRKAKEEGR